MSEAFVSTDTRRACPGGVIGSTVGMYPRGTGSNPVEGNEPFSTAERSERVENFLFRAMREYTKAGIEQATVAMRCHGANSPEPRRRTEPG